MSEVVFTGLELEMLLSWISVIIEKTRSRDIRADACAAYLLLLNAYPYSLLPKDKKLAEKCRKLLQKEG